MAARIPVLVTSTEYDPIQGGKSDVAAEEVTIVDKVAELWGATTQNGNRLHFEKMAHCMGDEGWEAIVAEPLAAWILKKGSSAVAPAGASEEGVPFCTVPKCIIA